MGLIRFFLALFVVVSHTEPFFGLTFINGVLSVQAFYMISGFYMALVLSEKYIGTNKSYKLFITNRLLRLYPIYWTVIFVIIISCLIYGYLNNGTNYGILNSYKDNYSLLAPSTLLIIIFSNLFIFFQDTLLFFEINLTSGLLAFKPLFDKGDLAGSDFALIGPAWTVGLELLFYLIAPFIVKLKNYFIIGLIIISLLIKYFTIHKLGLNSITWSFRFFPSELSFFLFGVLAYRLYKNKAYLKLNYLFYIGIIVFTVVTILYSELQFQNKYYLFFMSLFIIIPFTFNKTKHMKKDRFIGELSYPIYICHMFIVVAISATNIYIYNKGITAIIASIIAAIGLKYFISDKVENYRQKRLKSN